MLKENVKRELLLFWGMHPNMKFGINIVSYALDYNKIELVGALKEMVEAGFVDTHIQDGAALYSLTTNEKKRRAILEFAKHNHN